MDLIAEILSKLGFDWKLALMNLINVGIIFFLLKKYLFGVVSKKIEERREIIQRGVENATEAQTKLEMANVTAREIIDDAKKQANGIVAQAVKDSASLAESMRLKAVADVEALVTQAKQTIASEKGRMKEEIYRETADLVLLALQKVLGEQIDSKKDKKIVSDVLARLSE